MNWTELLMAHGLSLGATVVSGAVAWGKIHERIDHWREESTRRICSLEERCDHYDQFAERFAAMATDIKWIKEGLRQRRESGGAGHRGRDGGRDSDDSENG